MAAPLWVIDGKSHKVILEAPHFYWEGWYYMPWPKHFYKQKNILAKYYYFPVSALWHIYCRCYFRSKQECMLCVHMPNDQNVTDSMLRSAVGMTHVCCQDLWWAMPLHIFHWSCWDTIWIPTDRMDLCQTHCKQVPDFSRAQGHVVRFGPTGLHGLCFGCCFSGPLPLRSLINGPPIGVR